LMSFTRSLTCFQTVSTLKGSEVPGSDFL